MPPPPLSLPPSFFTTTTTTPPPTPPTSSHSPIPRPPMPANEPNGHNTGPNDTYTSFGPRVCFFFSICFYELIHLFNHFFRLCTASNDWCQRKQCNAGPNDDRKFLSFSSFL